MSIDMGINSNNLQKSHNNLTKDLLINLNNKKNIKRELLINEFIKKFPKVKLHTIIEVNKYYNCHYDKDNEDYDIENDNEIEIINNYIMNY